MIKITADQTGKSEIRNYTVTPEKHFCVGQLVNVKCNESFETKNGTIATLEFVFQHTANEAGESVTRQYVHRLMEMNEIESDKGKMRFDIMVREIKEIIQFYTGLTADKITFEGETFAQLFNSIATMLNTGGKDGGKMYDTNKLVYLHLIYKSGKYTSEYLSFSNSPFIQQVTKDATGKLNNPTFALGKGETYSKPVTAAKPDSTTAYGAIPTAAFQEDNGFPA